MDQHKKHDTATQARAYARKHSKLDRCSYYVVRRRAGDHVGYAVTPVGSVAPWDTLLAIYDEGQEQTF